MCGSKGPLIFLALALELQSGGRGPFLPKWRNKRFRIRELGGESTMAFIVSAASINRYKSRGCPFFAECFSNLRKSAIFSRIFRCRSLLSTHCLDLFFPPPHADSARKNTGKKSHWVFSSSPRSRLLCFCRVSQV